MENIFIGNYIGTELSANDPGKLLSYYHQQYPCSNVLTMLYLKMLEDEHPKDYEKNKDEAIEWLVRSANAGYGAAEDMLSEFED